MASYGVEVLAATNLYRGLWVRLTNKPWLGCRGLWGEFPMIQQFFFCAFLSSSRSCFKEILARDNDRQINCWTGTINQTEELTNWGKEFFTHFCSSRKPFSVTSSTLRKREEGDIWECDFVLEIFFSFLGSGRHRSQCTAPFSGSILIVLGGQNLQRNFGHAFLRVPSSHSAPSCDHNRARDSIFCGVIPEHSFFPPFRMRTSESDQKTGNAIGADGRTIRRHPFRGLVMVF